MSTAASLNEQADTPTPWWRVPHVWMVIGGPLVVVVASITTYFIAVRGADPLLNKEDYERDLKAATAHLDGQAKVDAMIKLQPAQVARNHAAAPVVPKTP